MEKGLKVSREILSVILTQARRQVFDANNIHNVTRETNAKNNKITISFKYVYPTGEFENIRIEQLESNGWYRVDSDARNYNGRTYWDIVCQPYAYIKGGF